MPGCRQMLIYKERNPIWGSKGNTVSPVLVRCQAGDRCWFTKERNPIWGSKQIQTPLSPVLVQLKQTACCFWASTAILWWVKVKIDLAVKTRCIQEGYECRTLAVGEQKVRKFCVYFSNITPQGVATLVSHSETNPKNNWMRGEQACLGIQINILEAFHLRGLCLMFGFCALLFTRPGRCVPSSKVGYKSQV